MSSTRSRAFPNCSALRVQSYDSLDQPPPPGPRFAAMGQNETDTNVITLAFGSKEGKFLEPTGNSASVRFLRTSKIHNSTLAILAPQRLELHILGRPRSSVLRKRRPEKICFALVPFEQQCLS